MTPRKKYEIAFFALGWLVAIGVAFQLGLKVVVTRLYSKVAEGWSTVGQAISDVEGRALTGLRHTSRSQYLEPFRPILRSAEALRNPSRRLFGAYDGDFPQSFAGLTKLEEGVRYRFPIISFYAAWGDKPEQQFPVRMLETIDRMGSVAMITWEPWVVDFDPELRRNLPPRSQREYATLASVARGDYDFYLVPWATAAAKFGRPIFLRFAHEMNDPYRYPWGPQNGNRPEDFIAAWKHVHLIFQKMNATNVLWVFSRHPSMPWFEYYYPGDEYVDWIGMGALNYGNVASWSRWWPFGDILSRAYPVLSSFGKPVMITELGSVKTGGDPEQWWVDARRSLAERFPAVRGAILFNQTHDDTLGGRAINWSPVNCSGCMTTLGSWVKEIRK